MKIQKWVIHLVLAWLLAATLVAAWIWLNIAWQPTPLWADLLAIVVLACWLIRWTRNLAYTLAQWRAARILSWVVLSLTAAAGILYLLLGAGYSVGPLGPLLVWIYGANMGPMRELVQAVNAGSPARWNLIVRLLAGCLGYGLYIVTVALAEALAWIVVSPRIAPHYSKWRTRLPPLRLRWGRWRALARRLVAGVVILGVSTIAMAAIANAGAREVHWQSMATGPDAPPRVRALILNRTT